jgi:hypothetical protein
MPRHARDYRLESLKSRRALEPRAKPYWSTISAGLRLGYRRNPTGIGSWNIALSDGAGGYTIMKLADADDIQDGNGREVMSFNEAQDRAREFHGRGGQKQAAGGKQPLTVLAAVKDLYAKDLAARSGDQRNVSRILHHLEGTPLAGKRVSLLTRADLTAWRDNLIASCKPATVNRTQVALKAALEIAAKADERIRHKPWETVLEALPSANKARENQVLSDDAVRQLVAAADAIGDEVGMWSHVLAETGARASQAGRLIVANLNLTEPAAPRLMVPSSRKGGKGKKANKLEPVAISVTLAARLRAYVRQRHAAPSDPLLLMPSGLPWCYWDERLGAYESRHAKTWDAIAVRAGIDATSYSLRHSSIVRQLTHPDRPVPVAVVARAHDTSESVIRQHYGAYILDHTDALTRAVLIDLEPRSNVVSIR